MTLHAGGAGDLRLEAVTKSFGDVVAVDGVSFSIEPGRFYSLLGPSGCGKTTTLRLVAGFELPDAGTITLSGREITRDPPDRRRVNTVFQHYALFPHLTVEDNVAFGLKREGLGKDEIASRLEEGLTTVRLQELRARYPRELSGGQQQRVALARALVKQPDALLLDEPLAALDLKLRKAMQRELKKLQERVGITFLYVTHDQEEALTLSDRIAVMNGGRILQEGTPEEIYERPADRFVADFIGETNLIDGEVAEVGPPVLVKHASGTTIRCTAPKPVTKGQRVFVAIRPERIEAVGAQEPHNKVDGVVTRRTYIGDLIEYAVVVFGDHELRVRTQNRVMDDANRWELGDRVQVGWSEISALALAEEGAELADEDSRHLVTEGLGA